MMRAPGPSAKSDMDRYGGNNDRNGSNVNPLLNQQRNTPGTAGITSANDVTGSDNKNVNESDSTDSAGGAASSSFSSNERRKRRRPIPFEGSGLSLREEKMFAAALKNSLQYQNKPNHKPADAPTFYPTPQEFADPFAYIAS